MILSDPISFVLHGPHSDDIPSTIRICRSLISTTDFAGGVAEVSTVGTELIDASTPMGVVVPLVDRTGLADVASTYAAKGDNGAAADTLMKKRKLDPEPSSERTSIRPPSNSVISEGYSQRVGLSYHV